MNGNYDDTNRGALFPKQKRSPKAADMDGHIEIGADVLQHILDNAQGGGLVKIRLSAWRRQLRQGGTMLSLKAEVPWQGDQQQGYGNRQAPQQRQQQRGGYGQAPMQGGYSQQSRGGYQQQGGYQRQNQMDFDQGNRNDLDDEIPF
jgi:hypothetical protein